MSSKDLINLRSTSGIELESLDKKNRFQVNVVEKNNGDLDKNGKDYSKDLEAAQRDEIDRFIENSDSTQIIKKPISRFQNKSSFRNTDKPSRFKDRQAATRFQVSAENDEESESDDENNLLVDDNLGGFDNKYNKSFRHFTREALPRLDNYRNIMSIQAAYRPTLDELHNATLTGKGGATLVNKQTDPSQDESGSGMLKFGWIQGVLMRCLLNIWGVMLFLRLSWVVGQAGIGEAILLILTTTIVTSITAVSMSAISTNGVIKGGGTYYMISRSLGPEFGGSIGLIFSMANAVACAMYVVGFCESTNDLLRSQGTYVVDGGVQDVRIIGSITIIILTFIVVVGMEWEAKAQIGLLVILLIAIGDFIIGTFVGPKSDLDVARGFVGYNFTLMSDNFFADYREDEGVNHDFFSVFAIFFPAATGILAGANISGDLRDPQTSIPKGTLLAIFLTTLSYLVMAVLAGATVTRQASGIVGEVLNGTFQDCASRECRYGLHNSFQVIELVSAFGPLIYAGCFAATLSSALASLVSAPKVFQALCKDNLYPFIAWFARGYGKNNEPVRGYVLTFFIAIAFILIGELNLIAPLISNFFLAAYTLINFSTFHASLAKPVGWRPTFRFYNMWLSLGGAVLCVAVMFLISWWTALLTLSVVLALYLIVSYRKPDVNWGSTTQAHTYKTALSSVQHLNNVSEHVKNYRPQILVLSGLPGSRPPLVDLAHLLTKNLSLLVCGHVLKGQVSNRQRHALNGKAFAWMKARKIKGFYTEVDDTDFEHGAKALIQACGVGKLRPNILLMGYKADWSRCPKDELNMYFDVMHKALDMYMSVAILRMRDGLDYTKVLGDVEIVPAGHHSSGDLTSVARGAAETAGVDAARHASSESVKQYSQQVSQAKEPLNVSSPSPSPNELDVPTCISPDGATNKASSISDLSMPATPISIPRSGANVSLDPANETTPRSELGGAVSSTAHTSEHSSYGTAGRKEAARRHDEGPIYRGPAGEELSKEVVQQLTQFSRKQKSGTIDVWWLYDDGGLTLLLPYIISTRRNWSNCRLRVFALANKQAELEFEQRSMASLLAKFRIDYSDLLLIPDITLRPADKTVKFFETLVAEFLVPENKDDPESARIPETDLIAMKDKTNRHLRLRELLLEHSAGSNLVVMTLPMPRRNIVTAPLYMAWLEVLTRDMPSFLLVRGNQTSVLTFYS